MDIKRRYPESPQSAAINAKKNQPQSQKKKLLLCFLGVVIVLAVIGGFCAFKQLHSENTQVKHNQYQAVFLSNGQVYFGKITALGAKTIKITDVYYLQAQQNVQPADKDKQSQVSLAKLGNELHGPEDVMHIERSQTLFWENLKDDAKVVQAIKQSTK